MSAMLETMVNGPVSRKPKGGLARRDRMPDAESPGRFSRNRPRYRG
ncbi:MAG TPA: hypothetical protein VF932_11105 [Anaerolineae bacterium]